MFFFKVDGPDQHSVKYKSKRTTCRFHSNAFNFKQDEILFLCFIHVILGSELLHNISFRLRLDVDIEGLCIELVSNIKSIMVLHWTKFEFCCLDGFALPFRIIEINPIQFPVWVRKKMKWNFGHLPRLCPLPG